MNPTLTIPNLSRKKFTIDEYHQMAEVGILSANERFELIQGEIIEMSPLGDKHTQTVRRINKLLNSRLPSYIIDQQNPIKIEGVSEPEPDIVVLPFQADYYPEGVTSQDVLLLIEVSDSTLKYDINIKLPLYAEAGIPEVWIVDLQHKVLITHTQPVEGKYMNTTQGKHGDTVSTSKFEFTAKVDELLG